MANPLARVSDVCLIDLDVSLGGRRRRLSERERHFFDVRRWKESFLVRGEEECYVSLTSDRAGGREREERERESENETKS